MSRGIGLAWLESVMGKLRQRPVVCRAALLVGFAGLLGCRADDGAGIPVPDPIPLVSMIRAMGAVPEGQAIDVIGLSGATEGVGPVTVRSGVDEVTVAATAAGGFVAQLNAKQGEKLEIRFKQSAPAELEVRPPSSLTPGPDLMSGEPPITAPVDGKTTVRGQGPAGEPALAVNFDTADVVVSSVDSTGLFSIEVPARSGDAIRVYLGEQPLGMPWRQTVP